MSSDMQMRPLSTCSLNGASGGRNGISLSDDFDAATDEMLFRDNVTWSKGKLRRAKIMSMITGNRQPTRKKIFSEIRESEDWKFWNIDVQGKSIRCAKIYNPAVLLEQRFSALPNLASVQRLEIEDPEGLLRTVPKQLVGMVVQLESLSMTWTKMKSLPAGLFQLPLNSLYLQRNQIKSLTGVERAASLTILDVSNNKLDSLPKTFGQLVNLVTLNLSGNALHELPDSIGGLSRLKALDVSCNRLRAVPDSIANAIELTSLDISNNQLSALPETLGGLPNLEDLRASSNQLRSLPANFGQLRRLNSLLLRNNRFDGAVPPQLVDLTNLQNLNMRENTLRSMDRPIVSLKYLVLDHNKLCSIDDGIIGCSNLQLLSLKHNSIADIGDDVCRLTALRSLYLSENADIDVVPQSLGRLPHLRRLGVAATKIRTVPLDVACMPSLTTLELDDCQELDVYLKMEYKNNGLAGVVEHLKKEQMESDRSDGSSGSRPLVDRTGSAGGGDDVELRKSKAGDGGGQLRNMAGLSIVPGTSCSPPDGEATTVVGGRGLVHIARDSICPNTVPVAAPRRSDVNPRNRMTMNAVAVQPLVEDDNENTAGYDNGGCLVTLPAFGDLVTASEVDIKSQQQQQQQQQQLQQKTFNVDNDEDVDEDDEMSALYAKVTKGRDTGAAASPAGGVSAAAVGQGSRPPTARKPALP